MNRSQANKVRISRSHIFLGLLIGPLLGVGLTVAGEVVTIDGQVHVKNPATPSQGTETWRLEELWRVGGDDDPDLLLGQVVRVCSDAQGNVYLFDAQLKEVHIFSANGDFQGTVVREGEGPGEVRRPRDMVLLPDGNIGVIEGFPGGLVSVDRAGVAAADWNFRLDPTTQFTTARSGTGSLVISAVENSHDEGSGDQKRHYVLASYSATGEQRVRYHQTRWDFNYQNHFIFAEEKALGDFRWCFDVGPDGRVYAATERNRYVVTVYDPDGSIDRVIERDYVPRRRTAAERSRMEALVERRFRTFPFELTVELADTEPVINWQHRGLQIDPDGNLWVRHSLSGRDQPGGVLLTFDLFDPAGHYLKQVAIACEGNPETDGLFLSGRDRMIRVCGFVDAMRTVYGGGQGGFTDEEEPDPIQVICYRIRR